MSGLRAGIVLTGVALTIALPAVPASALGPLHRQTVHITIPGTVTALSVRGEVGDITIVPGAVTRIVAVEQYNLAAPRLSHTLRHGVLSVAASCPQSGVLSLGLDDCETQLVVTVPRSVSVDAVDGVGDITSRGLRGDESLRTDVGRVLAVETVASKLSASTETGYVQLLGVRARSVSVRTGSGNIDAELGSTPQSVVARSDDGDVDLTLPSGTYAVHVHTDVGRAQVRGVTAEADAPRTLTASSDDGDVRIVGH